MSTKRIANMSMLVALAIIFSYIEFLIPINLGIPGMKLGLANLVIVTGLYYMSEKDVFLISLTRILLMGLLFGNGMSLLYSLTGGILSYIIMVTLKKKSSLSVFAVSVSGGVFHNIGQLAAAAFAVSNIHIFYYLPALLIAGVVTGSLIGIVSEKILKILKPNFFD